MGHFFYTFSNIKYLFVPTVAAAGGATFLIVAAISIGKLQ